MSENILDTPVADEMRTSFLEYAMSVIVARALPDARDGLKPVHRRILYGLYEQGMRPGTPYKKCARIVGDVMGRFHPHGDSAIYEALVRLAQEWSMRLPVVDGHGNFGSLGGDDRPAAMRYCLTYQARVRTAGGSLQIGSLVEGAAPDSDTDIDVKVLDRNGDPVRASKFFHSGTHPTLKLTTTEGYDLTGTHNHPVLCLEQIAGVPMLVWRLLEEIKPGSFVALQRPKAVLADLGTLTEDERSLAVLAGAMVSEGWCTDTNTGFANTDKAYFDAVLGAWNPVVGEAPMVWDEILPSGKTLHRLATKDLSLVHAGVLAPMREQRSCEKQVPAYVWEGTLAFKRAFLQSLFTGDGSSSLLARNTMQVSYSTRSRQLARDVQQLLLEFGIVSRQCFHATGEIKVYISNRRDARLFARNVGFLDVKQAKLEAELDQVPVTSTALSKKDYIPFLADYVRAAAPRGNRQWLTKHNIDRVERWERDGELILSKISDPEIISVIAPLVESGYYFAAVDSVVDAGVQDVFSIRVDSEDHSFITDGFVSHNTECRMAPAAMAMVEEIGEETVNFVANYDGTEREPDVLPASFPNLLVNGSTGIAVGMATNMAPHNLIEVVDACKHLLAHPDATLDDIMAFVPGPDLPTGGTIVGLAGVREAYATGRGSFRIRATAEIADVSARRKGIIISELPYTVGPEKVITKIKDLINAKKLLGISDIKDLSDRKVGLRLVIECKTGFNPVAVLEELYKTTPLEESFGINNVALLDGKPQTLNLIQLCRAYLDHRLEVVERRTRYRKNKAEARAHIVEGLLIALVAIDEVVAVIRKSKDTETARAKLRKTFKLSEIQANHILEMPLRRLTSMEVTKLKDELKELKALIAELDKILSSDEAIREVIAHELDVAAETFGNPRRSRLLEVAPDLAAGASVSLEVPDDPCQVWVTAAGTVARSTPLTGGRSSKATKADLLTAVIDTTNRSVIGAITDRGRWLPLTAVEIPDVSAERGMKAKGGPASEFFELQGDERIVAFVGDIAEGSAGLAIGTRNGVVKRLATDAMPTKSGQEIIGLKDDTDRVVGVVELASEDDDVVFVSSSAQLLRTPAADIRPQGRSAGGVAGMRLGDDAHVIAFGALRADNSSDDVVVTISDAANAKVSEGSEYPSKGRGGAGVRCQTFKKGETSLVAAHVGSGNLFAVSEAGNPVALPTERSRRDASGAPLSEAASAVAFAVRNVT